MDKIELIKRNTEEIINEKDIKSVLKKSSPVTYCGYETSGEIHLGHLVTITKLLDLQEAGFKVKVLFADWHTWLNQKGDWDFIHKQVKNWQKGFKAAGLNKAEFILGSDFQRSKDYIDDVLTLAGKITLNRGLRSMQQVARDLDNAKISQVIYPLMQIVDIKHLGIDFVQSGIEQRKIHALGIELLPEIKYKVPVFVHTPLIPSLTGKGKMSSSELSSMITIRDSDKAIMEKINNAYCPAKVVESNPILSILRLVIFPRFSQVTIKRKKEHGGDMLFIRYDDLEKFYKEEKIHPLDLKHACAEYLTAVISPIRKSFKT